MKNTIITRRAGFTIIELLVSVVIIALLTTVTTLSFLTAQRRARDNASKIQIQTIANAVEAYYATNKTFPGKIDITKPIALSTLDTAWITNNLSNCETIVTTASPDANYKNPIVYFYYPFSDPAQSCQSKNSGQAYIPPSTSSTLYDPADYMPYPTWIPGLGSFLSPPPITKNYKGGAGGTIGDGGQASAYQEVLKASDATGSINVASTLVYRHLLGGYAVYTRLETSSGDQDAIAPGSVIGSGSDTPNLPVDIQTVSGQYIFMIRK